MVNLLVLVLLERENTMRCLVPLALLKVVPGDFRPPSVHVHLSSPLGLLSTSFVILLLLESIRIIPRAGWRRQGENSGGRRKDSHKICKAKSLLPSLPAGSLSQLHAVDAEPFSLAGNKPQLFVSRVFNNNNNTLHTISL